MSMVRMVAWGMIDVPQDIDSEDFIRIEDEVYKELKLLGMGVYIRRAKLRRIEYRLRHMWMPGDPLCTGSLRECCKKAVEILDAAK